MFLLMCFKLLSSVSPPLRVVKASLGSMLIVFVEVGGLCVSEPPPTPLDCCLCLSLLLSECSPLNELILFSI